MTDQQMMLVAGAGLFTAYFIYKKIKMGGNKVKLKEMLQNGAKVIDVRSKGEFAGGSFPGAINIPTRLLTAEGLAEYSTSTLFVVYCAGPHCNGANKAAVKLAALGYSVKEMIGGVCGWLDPGRASSRTSPSDASFRSRR